MGFVSTIIYLFIVGFLIQIWYRRSLREKHKDAKFLIGLILILGIWGAQFLIYFNIIPLPSWLSKVIPWIPDQSGRTWLWNSWQFWEFTGAQPALVMPRGVGQIAVMLVLSYPFWYFFGTWVAKGIFGNKTYQRGASWLFQIEKGEAPAPTLPDKTDS
ncbi:MAG TPA: hypothetical protein VKM55_26570 [Candidatus Lokiarchaeia archaeon]|nr:hypothetical protein [Candidatus Lokiarchaeia archaeon]